MRRRFLSYDLSQAITPVFAVSISVPLSTWKKATHILTTRSRTRGNIDVGKYAVDIASFNYVCTMNLGGGGRAKYRLLYDSIWFRHQLLFQ